MQTFYIWRSPHGLLYCLPLSACVKCWDVCELDDLLVVRLLLLSVDGDFKVENAGVTMWMRI